MITEVEKEKLYTARWNARQLPPSSHQRALIEILSELIGVAEKGGSDTGRKVAIVVGHNVKARGVDSPYLKLSEYDYNYDLAVWIMKGAEFEVQRFIRRWDLGYSAEVAECYHRVEAWNPDLIVELHCNASGSGAAYASCWHHSASSVSKKVSVILSKHFSGGLRIRNGGAKVIERRGRASVTATNIPTVIAEPFFMDEKTNCEKVASLGMPGMAEIYIKGIEAALKVI